MAHTPNTNRSGARSSRWGQRTIPITNRYLNMRMNGRMSLARRAKWFLPVLAAMLMLAAMPKTGRAQCPTSAPTGCGWIPATITTSMDGTPLNGADSLSCTGMSPTGCCVAISFCYMCCNGQIQVILNGIETLNSNCIGMTADQLIDFATWYAEVWSINQFFGQGMGCDPKLSPCPAFTQVLSYASSCWKLNTIVGDRIYTMCGDACVCNISFDVCWNTSTMQLQYSDYTYSQTGPSCPPTCPNEPSIWTPNTCYNIPCPDGKGGHQ